jgi:hypothetical protein
MKLEEIEKIISVTEYAKQEKKSRQAILYKIKKNKLPKHVSANKVGSTWILTIKEI